MSFFYKLKYIKKIVSYLAVLNLLVAILVFMTAESHHAEYSGWLTMGLVLMGFAYLFSAALLYWRLRIYKAIFLPLIVYLIYYLVFGLVEYHRDAVLFLAQFNDQWVLAIKAYISFAIPIAMFTGVELLFASYENRLIKSTD